MLGAELVYLSYNLTKMNVKQLELLNLYSAKTRKIKESNIKYPIVEGYYNITKTNKLTFHDNWVEWEVFADWLPLEPSDEGENFINVRLHLGNLFNSFSCGPKEINPEMLTGAIIKVEKVTVFKYDWQGAQKMSLGADWSIEGFQEVTIEEPPCEPVDLQDETVTYTKSTDDKQINDILNSKPY